MAESRMQALVVDDNLALARVTQFALQRIGCEATTAANGRIALDLARARQFDVVVTDQQMPEMTGVELCRNLRNLPGYGSTPLVMLTAKGLEMEFSTLQEELGIRRVFPKPFSPSEVAAAVQDALTTAAP